MFGCCPPPAASVCIAAAYRRPNDALSTSVALFLEIPCSFLGSRVELACPPALASCPAELSSPLPPCLYPLQAYLSVAPYVAAFPQYFEPLAWHLLRSKLRHWEKGLRELAAQALAGGQAGWLGGWVSARVFGFLPEMQHTSAQGAPSYDVQCMANALFRPVLCALLDLLACCAALVPHRPAFFLESALPFLLPLCTDGVLEARHGAVAALAELLPALRCGFWLTGSVEYGA